jgi:hypothetical protein
MFVLIRRKSDHLSSGALSNDEDDDEAENYTPIWTSYYA